MLKKKGEIDDLIFREPIIKDILEQGKELKMAKGILETSQEAGTAVICVGSGKYSFTVSH